MNEAAQHHRLRIEALVAYPPTTLCKQILALLKTVVAEYPDRVRMDVYYAGEAPDATPTKGYQGLDKRKTVPSGYINGQMVISGELPALDALKAILDDELAKDPSEWQA
ncbi:MAG TPA: hypothetical protein VN436_06285 [Holophaga sp.]|nr:hypothetical protein [Holophaga sp.]